MEKDKLPEQTRIVNFTEAGFKAGGEKPANSALNSAGYPQIPVESPQVPMTPPSDRKEKMFRILKWSAIVVLPLFFVLGASVWGMNAYDRYYKQVPIEEIVPADVNLVLKISASPDSRQFQMLEKNLQKFPGYETLKKKLDKVGEGKTLSQALQDKLKESNLDFQEDIKPVLGENIFVFVPDLSPLGRDIKSRLTYADENVKKMAEKIPFGPESPAAGSTAPKVLGEADDFSYTPSSEKKIQPLDFITGAEIKDLKEAKRVLDKMKKSDQYETISHESEGYAYYEVRPKATDDASKKEGLGAIFSSGKSYHALLGGNWFMASNEDLIKELIISRSQRHLTAKISFKKNPPIPVLGQDADYQKTISNFADPSGENLITAYYKLDMKKFFAGDCGDGGDCGESVTDFIKYPDTYVSGFSVNFSDDGLNLKNLTNKVSLDNFKNIPYSDGMAKFLAQKVDDRWLDVFFEMDGVKDLYYSFKRGNLTEKGLDKWNEGLKGASEEYGIDFEKDIIDQFNGNMAFALFTKSGMEPEEVFVAEIKDPQALVATINKMVEKYKETYASGYLGYLGNDSGPVCQPLKNPSDKEYCDYLAENEKRIQSIRDSKMTEADTPEGKTYSYRPEGADWSFDFGFVKNTLILGSHFAAVQGLMREFQNPQEAKLSQNEFFGTVSEKMENESGYAKVFVNSAGLWNAVTYYLGQYLAPESGDPDGKEMFDAVGSIVRTIKLVGANTHYVDNMQGNSTYWKIEELPADEKARAEKGIEKMAGSVESAKGKAKAASFRSTVVSINPAAMTCADESILNTIDPGPGKNICSDAKIENSTYPAMVEGVCDDDTYIASATDPGAGDGQYSYTASCSVGGAVQTITCTENGCIP